MEGTTHLLSRHNATRGTYRTTVVAPPVHWIAVVLVQGVVIEIFRVPVLANAVAHTRAVEIQQAAQAMHLVGGNDVIQVPLCRAVRYFCAYHIIIIVWRVQLIGVRENQGQVGVRQASLLELTCGPTCSRVRSFSEGRP